MKPVYLKIVDDLVSKIKTGTYKEGDMLPPENSLLETYGVSRMTVRKALALLVEQDLLYRVKGRGTFV
ncbi:GntR family transcriptional regulator, partial [Vibrio mediterranei]